MGKVPTPQPATVEELADSNIEQGAEAEDDRVLGDNNPEWSAEAENYLIDPTLEIDDSHAFEENGKMEVEMEVDEFEGGEQPDVGEDLEMEFEEADSKVRYSQLIVTRMILTCILSQSPAFKREAKMTSMGTA